jgi:hypothetical protein
VETTFTAEPVSHKAPTSGWARQRRSRGALRGDHERGR